MLETLPSRPGRHRVPRRRWGLIVLLLIFLLLVGSLVAGGAYYQWAVGASGAQRPFVLAIPTGATGADVGDLLVERGVIRSSFAFRMLARFRGFEQGFQAGRYRIRTNLPVLDALALLKRGPFVETLGATFPEGYTVAQTARRAQQEVGIPARRLVRLAESGHYTLEPYLPKGTRTVEGFLFPSTYDFVKGARPADVIDRMLGQFETVAEGLPWERAERLGVTPYEVVIVASMIEREARFQEDRPKVAAVIYNRLRRGMALQIDATVQYALGRPKERLTYDDLKVESPYNTYLHAGLPPTPIASPGLPALRAALDPADADYLYYVVIDDQGHHAFTASYDEFVRLKNQART